MRSTDLNSIARSDNYLICGMLWAHPVTFHDDDDKNGDFYDNYAVVGCGQILIACSGRGLEWSHQLEEQETRAVGQKGGGQEPKRIKIGDEDNMRTEVKLSDKEEDRKGE